MPHRTNITLCKLVNRIRIELLTFGSAAVLPPWQGQVMSPVFSRLYYISNGSFTLTDSDGNSFALEQGNWYLIPSQYSFSYRCSESMEHFYFHIKLCDFDGTDLLRYCKAPLQLKNYQPIDSAFLLQSIESKDVITGLFLRQKISQILLSFIEENQIDIRCDDYSPCIYKALQYIKQNLSMGLSLSEIAENIFVSKSTLTKHFKKELSMSVNEYICNTIFSEAERLLMTTSISIGDLSQRFGFSDQLYFSRRFKEIFGKSPREYRKERQL